MDANTPRIALLVTDYLGNTKGEYFYVSATEAMSKVADLVTWPDTKVYQYNTDNNGERTGEPQLMWHSQEPRTTHFVRFD